MSVSSVIMAFNIDYCDIMFWVNYSNSVDTYKKISELITAVTKILLKSFNNIHIQLIIE